jgi:hypothetical protein
MQRRFYFLCFRLMRSFASKRVVSRAFVVGIIPLLTVFSFTTFALADYYPAPSVLDPSVFSFQNTTPKIDGTSGALTQNVSLDIPSGRKGVQPNLSLNYNSQNTDPDNIFGYGWTLPIPYIARLNKTGSQNLYGLNAYFTSSFDGELAPATSSTATINPTGSYTVYLWGAGGGGSYLGGAAGAGAYVVYSATSTPGSQTITIGQGGAGGTASAGGAGGSGMSRLRKNCSRRHVCASG